MKELLRSNDAVLISYVSALLEEEGIGFMVADTNMSVLEGSVGALPAVCSWPATRWHGHGPC